MNELKKGDKRALSDVVGILFIIVITIIAFGVVAFAVNKIINDEINKSKTCSQSNLDKVKFNHEKTCFTPAKEIIGRTIQCNPFDSFPLPCISIRPAGITASPKCIDAWSRYSYGIGHCGFKCTQDNQCQPNTKKQYYEYSCADLNGDGNYNDDGTCVSGGKFLFFSIDVGDIDIDKIKFTMEGGGNERFLEFEDGTTEICTNEDCYKDSGIMANYAKCWDDALNLWSGWGGTYTLLKLKKNEGHTYYTGVNILPVTNEKPEVIRINPIIDGKTCDASDIIDEIPGCIKNKFPLDEPLPPTTKPPKELDCANLNLFPDKFPPTP